MVDRTVLDADAVLDADLVRIDAVQLDGRTAAVAVATSFFGVRRQAADVQAVAATISAAAATAADDGSDGNTADAGSCDDAERRFSDVAPAATADVITAAPNAAARADAGSAGCRGAVGCDRRAG